MTVTKIVRRNMEGINEYVWLIAVIGFAAVIALAVFLIIGQRKLLKTIVDNKFAMNGFEEIDVATGRRTYSVTVSNRSMNDAAVSAFGVVSGLKYFDFTERFKAAHGEKKAVNLAPRTPVKLTLSTEELERPVFSALQGKKLRGVKIYVIDSAGNLYLQRAANFEKTLRIGYKKYLARLSAAKKAKETEDKVRGGYEFCQNVRARKDGGEPVAFKDRIKIVLLRGATAAELHAAEENRIRADYLASLYTEEAVSAAEKTYAFPTEKTGENGAVTAENGEKKIKASVAAEQTAEVSAADACEKNAQTEELHLSESAEVSEPAAGQAEESEAEAAAFKESISEKADMRSEEAAAETEETDGSFGEVLSGEIDGAPADLPQEVAAPEAEEPSAPAGEDEAAETAAEKEEEKVF